MKIQTKDFIHNKKSKVSEHIREIIFGIEDGIVSTLGALTGIAIATESQFTVIISGLVIISVESISMGIGSYVSNKSAKEIEDRKLDEENMELDRFRSKEKKELLKIFIKDGWPEKLAQKMTQAASKKRDLMLKEMAYRELGLIPQKISNNFQSGIFMFFSYIFGGLIPLISYFFLPMNIALLASLALAATGLFLLGATASRFTFIKWWKVGFRIFLLGAVSTIVGFSIGQLANYFK